MFVYLGWQAGRPANTKVEAKLPFIRRRRQCPIDSSGEAVFQRDLVCPLLSKDRDNLTECAFGLPQAGELARSKRFG